MAATNKSKKDRAAEILSADEYLKTVLDNIPADQRDAVLERLGTHVLRQDEFSRLSDEATAKAKEAESAKAAFEQKYQENLVWRESANKAYQENVEALKAKESAIATPSGLDPAKFLTKEEAGALTARARSEIEAQTLALSGAIDNIRARHFKEFGEYLTQEELIGHARKIGKPVDAAYEDMTRDRFAEKQKKATEKWKTDERVRIEKEVRSSLGPSAIYPVNNSEPTALSGLVPEQQKNFGVQAAVQAMLRGEIKPQG